MKILAIEDNSALQDILKDILVGKGHTVEIATTISEAIKKIEDFGPETIFMETEVDGEDSSPVLVHAHENNNISQLNVILIKGIGTETPTDNPFIRTVINKPFKSEDILSALETANGFLKVEEPRKMPKIMLRGAFEKIKTASNKMSTGKGGSTSLRASSSLEGNLFGKSFVTFEHISDNAYKLIKRFPVSEYSVLIISSDNVKAVWQKTDSSLVEVMTLSTNKKGNTMDINALGTLFVAIENYITSHSKPVVLIDDLANIIDSNGLNQSLVFIHQLVRNIQTEGGKTIIVSVDPAVLTIKDRNILLGDMSEYKE